jgi:hypothetical protein
MSNKSKISKTCKMSKTSRTYKTSMIRTIGASSVSAVELSLDGKTSEIG